MNENELLNRLYLIVVDHHRIIEGMHSSLVSTVAKCEILEKKLYLLPRLEPSMN